MAKHILGNGQTTVVSASQWNSDSLAFSGATSPGATATFTGPNTLATIADTGTASAHGFGTISVAVGGSLATNGLQVDHATLSLTERPSTSATFAGISQISNGSTLTATGFGGTGNYAVNDVMTIDGSSTVNMNYVSLSGSGTIALSGSNALLRAGTVAAGETVKLDGGMLSLTNGMHFLGTITDSQPAASRIASGASVGIYNAFDAVSETFNRTTGMLKLLNAQGTAVASLTFAGHGDLYAAPTTGLATNYIAISSHASAGMMPVTFTA